MSTERYRCCQQTVFKNALLKDLDPVFANNSLKGFVMFKFRVLVGMLSFALLAATNSAFGQIKLMVDATNSGYPDSQVFIGFYTTETGKFDITNVDASGPKITWIYDGTGTAGNWYSAKQLSQGVMINRFVAGRIFVCYNPDGTGGWTVDPANRVAEPAQTPILAGMNNANFWMRYDKMELTVTPSPNDVADLTSIDYWAVPMTLNATKNGKAPAGKGVYEAKGLLQGVTAKDIYKKLNALTTPPVSGLTPIGKQPFPALVPGEFTTQSGPTPSAFARIIGPSSYPSINPQGLPMTPYYTLQAYMNHLKATYGPGTQTTSGGLGNGVIAKISGKFGGTTSYKLKATIDDDLTVTISGDSPANTKIVMKWDDLEDPAGIYGSNPTCTINGVVSNGIPNNIYGWVIGDFCGGMNIGAVGSTVKVSTDSGMKVAGELPSSQWYDLNPHTQMFSKLQPDNPYYNTWAETLFGLSQAYNFAFTDRIKAAKGVQVSLDQTYVNELTISLLPAAVK